MPKEYLVAKHEGYLFLLIDLELAEQVETSGGIGIPPTKYALNPIEKMLEQNMVNRGMIKPTTVIGAWCKSPAPLKVGSIVKGSFDFDAIKNPDKMGRPIFTPSE